MNTKALWIALGCAATVFSLSAEQTENSKALTQMKALIGNWSGTFQWTGGRNDSGSMNATYYVTGNGSAVVENLINESTPVMTSPGGLKPAGADPSPGAVSAERRR